MKEICISVANKHDRSSAWFSCFTPSSWLAIRAFSKIQSSGDRFLDEALLQSKSDRDEIIAARKRLSDEVAEFCRHEVLRLMQASDDTGSDAKP